MPKYLSTLNIVVIRKQYNLQHLLILFRLKMLISNQEIEIFTSLLKHSISHHRQIDITQNDFQDCVFKTPRKY